MQNEIMTLDIIKVTRVTNPDYRPGLDPAHWRRMSRRERVGGFETSSPHTAVAGEGYEYWLPGEWERHIK